MAPNVRTSTGIGFSSRSMNSDKLSKVATISGGIVGDVNADSIERTSCSRCTTDNLAQQLTKDSQNKSLATLGWTLAKSAQALSDGEGEDFNNSTDN